MKLSENTSISALTTMRLGGNARYTVDIETLADLTGAYEFARAKNLPTYILGGGSNVVGTDADFNGLVMLNRLTGIEVISEQSDEITLCVGSGEDL
ncbi:MAG: FAD-binding protein, partial [Coriobacteriia bacterium]|nr:FAD-binding protein [Coriobacteriia bacterium]